MLPWIVIFTFSESILLHIPYFYDIQIYKVRYLNTCTLYIRAIHNTQNNVYAFYVCCCFRTIIPVLQFFNVATLSNSDNKPSGNLAKIKST